MIKILDEVMREIVKAKRPVTTRELSRRLKIEESALIGMLEFLQRKGKLSFYSREDCPERGNSACASCIFVKGCRARDKGVEE